MVSAVTIKHREVQYKLNEDGEWVCAHINQYVEKACCPPGTEDCGCKGSDWLICPNPECSGFTDGEVETSTDNTY